MANRGGRAPDRLGGTVAVFDLVAFDIEQNAWRCFWRGHREQRRGTELVGHGDLHAAGPEPLDERRQRRRRAVRCDRDRARLGAHRHGQEDTLAAMADHLFLRACRREPVPRTPIWMMRQAGRYLPAYRAVRARASFLELCRNPELACEVTLQPIDEYGFDAAILFSDILITLPGMGLEVEFPESGPKILTPVRTSAQIAALAVPEPVPYVLEA